MSVHKITYVGPSSLAVPTATMLADSAGLHLRSSERPAQGSNSWEQVVLVLTVEGSTEAVEGAVANLRASLPAGARIDVGPAG